MAKVSVITDKKSRLAKKFGLSGDGELIKSTAEQVIDGEIETIETTLSGLVSLIKTLSVNQCLALGHTAKPGPQPIKCSKMAGPGDLTRTKRDLLFSDALGDLFLLLDFDDSNLRPDEAVEKLSQIDPQFKTAGIAVVPSSSAYLYNGDEELTGAGNYHIFTTIEGNPEEYCRLLFSRLILAGFGKAFISKPGAVTIKSIFDVVATSQERVIYETNPVLEDGLVSKRLDHVLLQEGDKIVASKLKMLSPSEELELRTVVYELRESVKGEAEMQRMKYMEERARKKAVLNNTSFALEMASMASTAPSYDKMGRPVLELPSDTLIYNEQGGEFYVRELLMNPQEGLKLPDPWEPFIRGDEKKGIPGRGVATMLGMNMIYSHAHCGMVNIMRWTVEDLAEVFTTADITIRKFVWKAISSGAQELVSTADMADISELADGVRNGLKADKGGSAKEKKHVMARLKPAQQIKDCEDEVVLRMNAKFGVANIQGKTSILYEEYNDNGCLFETVFSTPQSLDTYFKSDSIRVPGVPGGELSAYKYWEKNPERNTYSGVTFLPSADIFREPGKLRVMQQGGVYNMFQGYIMDPEKATSCERIKQHLKEVWCSGIVAEYEYVIAWLAHLFQHPASVSTTALVLQSIQGIGKNIIIDKILVKTLGVHALSTANTEDVVGRFNSHLGMNVFVYANELAYTAQTSVKSTLKTLLSDEHRMIEAKGVNKIKARNYTSLIVGSNEGWLLAIEASDRRYVYLSTSSHRVHDRHYFEALLEEIENGGREAFILFLLKYDYSGTDLKQIPNQNQRQKRADFLRSAHPITRFFYSIVDTDNDLNPYVGDGSEIKLKKWRAGGSEIELTKMQLFDLFIKYTEYFSVNRQYDDIQSVLMQLQQARLLAMDVRDVGEFPLTLKNKAGKNVLVLAPIDVCKQLMGFTKEGGK